MANLLYFRNSVVERWPESIRTMLNNSGKNGKGSIPFESWYGPQGLESRNQSTRVLFSFFVIEYHINNVTWSEDGNSLTMGDAGHFPEMWFPMSEDSALGDDILDIVQGSNFDIEHMKNPIHQPCLNIIMQANPTPQNNPLLFWVGLILQTEEFGNQPRLEFDGLKDELTTREKLEAFVHYMHAFSSWISLVRVGFDPILFSKNLAWIDDGSPRPTVQQGDPAEFSRPHWQAFKAHFEALRIKWLVKGSNSPIGVILELL
ncbi:hypothetical protein M413DRAFT_24793 [Hebeloma cylindrosporum]|uniref:Uncharacterized protein n=1 Tax=Hebeloma cylindrosporum TaxID=76867 RepID=A0A0C3CA13_HEBCY|nr:hypothetical protein M413DRAFT_24793 [Hebeloma cylindrosporum h7]